MPCICYGAVSGKEEYDNFLVSEKGKKTMDHLTKAASLIMSHNINVECDLNNIEFRQMFVKCFLHIMVGCDEEGKPKANTD
jgi:hypothetical protein